jgi:hypothetical protein
VDLTGAHDDSTASVRTAVRWSRSSRASVNVSSVPASSLRPRWTYGPFRLPGEVELQGVEATLVVPVVEQRLAGELHDVAGAEADLVVGVPGVGVPLAVLAPRGASDGRQGLGDGCGHDRFLSMRAATPFPNHLGTDRARGFMSGNRPLTCVNAGGRYWVRTSDLFGVNEARYHCANRPGETRLGRALTADADFSARSTAGHIGGRRRPGQAPCSSGSRSRQTLATSVVTGPGALSSRSFQRWMP